MPIDIIINVGNTNYIRVSGMIINFTPAPLPAVKVSFTSLIDPSNNVTTFTDTGGKFSVSIAVGSYAIQFSRFGYTTVNQNKTFSVDTNISITMSTSTDATGTFILNNIKDINGSLNDATVTFYNSSNTYSGLSNSEGSCTITGVTAGNYTFKVEKEWHSDSIAVSTTITANTTTTVNFSEILSITGGIKGVIKYINYTNDTPKNLIAATVYYGTANIITSSDGSYELKDIILGSASIITVSKTGYYSQSITHTLLGSQIDLIPDIVLLKIPSSAIDNVPWWQKNYESAVPNAGLITEHVLTNYSAKDLWEYDTTTATWSQKADCSVYRQFPGSFNIASIGYVIGGITKNGVFRDSYAYHPRLNTWTTIATFIGEARYYPIAFGTSTYGYIGAGHSINGSHLSDMYQYSVASNMWATLANYPGYKGHFKTCYTTENTYLVGIECNNDSDLYTNNLEVISYNEGIGTWSKYSQLLELKGINENKNKIINDFDGIKDVGISFLINNNIYTGLGLGKNYKINITPNVALSYYQAEYYINRIIPQIFSAPAQDINNRMICQLCGAIISNNFETIDISDITSHRIVQCSTCKAYYTNWGNSWAAGYANVITISAIVDNESMSLKYPEFPDSSSIAAIKDEYIIEYSRKFRVVS